MRGEKGMEKEKKGLFGRLLDFWKEKIGMGGTDSIGFWNGAEDVEKHFDEMGAVASLNQGEMRKTFWEESVDEVLEEKEQDDSVLEEQKKIFFAEAEERKEENLLILEEAEKMEEKQGTKLFRTEVFREKRQAEEEKGGLGETFLWEMPAEEPAKRRIIPVTAEPEDKEEPTAEEAQESLERKVTKREEPQIEPVVDIEKLMRQMTKKLWEEREGCGRRLR